MPDRDKLSLAATPGPGFDDFDDSKSIPVGDETTPTWRAAAGRAAARFCARVAEASDFLEFPFAALFLSPAIAISRPVDCRVLSAGLGVPGWLAAVVQRLRLLPNYSSHLTWSFPCQSKHRRHLPPEAPAVIAAEAAIAKATRDRDDLVAQRCQLTSDSKNPARLAELATTGKLGEAVADSLGRRTLLTHQIEAIELSLPELEKAKASAFEEARYAYCQSLRPQQREKWVAWETALTVARDAAKDLEEFLHRAHAATGGSKISPLDTVRADYTVVNRINGALADIDRINREMQTV